MDSQNNPTGKRLGQKVECAPHKAALGEAPGSGGWCEAGKVLPSGFTTLLLVPTKICMTFVLLCGIYCVAASAFPMDKATPPCWRWVGLGCWIICWIIILQFQFFTYHCIAVSPFCLIEYTQRYSHWCYLTKTACEINGRMRNQRVLLISGLAVAHHGAVHILSSEMSL